MMNNERDRVRAERAEIIARVKKLTNFELNNAAAKLYNLCTVEGRLLSARNRVILAMQAAARGLNLSEIGGFDQWKRAGRAVNKGEKALFIAFPRIGKEDDGEGGEKEALKGFSLAFVFDRSQTHEMTDDERLVYGKRRARRPAPVATAAVDDTPAPAPVEPVPASSSAPSSAPSMAAGVNAIMAAFTAA